MKLQAKVSLFLSALLLASLVSQGGILSYFLDKSLRNKANEDLLQEATQVSNLLDTFIINSQTDILNIGHNMNIQALRKGQLGKIETYLHAAFSANSRFDNGFFILDAQGVLVVDYPVSEIKGINLAFREYFKKTFSEKKPIISSPYISKRTGAMVITFTAPLLSYQGQFFGLLAGSVNILRYNFAGSIRDIQIGQTGKIMIYDSKGKILYYPDIALIAQEEKPPNANTMFRGLPQGSKGVIDHKTADGTEHSLAFHPLKTTDWMVGVMQEKEEILTPLNNLKKQIALILIAALVVAAGIGIWGMGILTKPIKAFSKSIKHYKGGDWEEPAALIARRDELGELGKSFKSMTSLLSETLSSLTESETKYRALVHGSLVGVFLIQKRRFMFVNPRLAEIFGYGQEEMQSSFDPLELVAPIDRDRVLNIMSRPLSENHRLVHFFWQGLRKDGSLIDVEVMGTPMLYQGKPALHGTLVDITERKLQERKQAQLNRVREELITSKTMEEKLKIITTGLVEIFKADFARIWIVKPGDRCSDCIHAQVKEGPQVCRDKEQCLHLVVSSGRYTHIDGKFHSRVPYENYMIGLIAAGNISKFLTNDVIHEPIIKDQDWAKEIGLVSSAGYRLLSTEGISIGVMALFSRQVISSDDDVLLEGLANSTAQVIQTAKIEESLRKSEEALKTLSLKDDLTGLYNRRGFFTLAEQGLKTAQRMGTELLLIYGDLDNLKKTNDTLGHKEGDRALVDISQILKETFRESDIIARIGGDEFVILALNSLETSAEKLINRFDQVLNDHHLQTKRSYKLSMSLGMACFDPQNPCSIEVLLAEADKLMYANKQTKR